MSVLFFGDSLTEGQNCEKSFTDFLPQAWDIYNFGVGGTTIGEYSIYPVDGQSLLGQIANHQELIKHADTIFIEYGSNDVSAIMCGFATVKTVIVSFIKAIDWIKQLNPDVKIIFLTFGGNVVVSQKGSRMCDYLNNEYFAKFDFTFPVSWYSDTYNKIIYDISKVCDTIYMFDIDSMGDEYLSDDKIHPNVEGHKRIAETILNQYK